MRQIAIPCMMMRGGTSKGPYLNMADLPTDPATRDRVLLAIMGSPDPRQIDGIGGAEFLTSKLAMVGRSSRSGIDVDYLFAQIAIGERRVDTRPPCGNMLAGVGPYAIETGLVPARTPETIVAIYNVNTGATVEALVQTPSGAVTYDGDAAIDGVPGSAAPIVLNFSNVAGGKTGALLPTGQVRETIDGISVSCVDAAMPMMIVNAADLGLSGAENGDFFAHSQSLMARIESLRRVAGERMGLGDVSETVVPKVGLVSRAGAGGTIRSRYLTPHTLHAAHAVTGGICVATAACLPGSVAEELVPPCRERHRNVVIEHPSGTLHVRLQFSTSDGAWRLEQAGVVRTARMIMRGHVFVADRLWPDRALSAGVR